MKRFKQANWLQFGLLIFVMLLFAPAKVFAQVEECDAVINVSTDPNSEFILNSPIGIQIELGAGNIVDLSNEVPWLDIFQFEYQMDCTLGDTFPTCNDPGNTVEYSGNLQTDCLDENGVAINLDPPTIVGETVTFIPLAPGTAIRNGANETCNVSFDITVTGIAPANAGQEVVELSGWLSNSDPSQGICSNGLAAADSGSVSFNLATTNTIFRVTKDFSDQNPAPVDVYIKCDAGLPLENSFTLVDGGSVDFSVRSYTPGQLDCTVWEEPVPGGYTPDYVAGATTGIGITSDDEDGCYFNEVQSGVFTCDITNDPDPGMFTVNKTWVLDEDNAGAVNENVDVTISCDQEILTNGAVFDAQSGYWTLSGTIADGGSLTAEVVTSYDDPANCMGEEVLADSFVESYDDCQMQEVPVGSDIQCTFVNTVFFEGVPTLSQYGVALMALLMLGVGLVGFRRFA